MFAVCDGELICADTQGCDAYTRYPFQFLLAVRWSDDQALTNLESHFYRIANEQFTEGLKTADRPLDLVRGVALINVYLYSHARYHEVCCPPRSCFTRS
jgi:hypothetical protein